MEDLFKTIFEAFPKTSSIFFKGECSDCRNSINIEIIPTLSGFGLLGGAIVEYPRENYAPKCPDCYKSNGKMAEHHKINSEDSLLLHKKDLLSAILANHKWMRK